MRVRHRPVQYWTTDLYSLGCYHSESEPDSKDYQYPYQRNGWVLGGRLVFRGFYET